MTLSLTHDPEADAIYIYLRNVPYAYGKNLDDERRVDYGEDRQPRGIELLSVSFGVNMDDLPEQAAITRLLEEHGIKVFA